LSPMPLQLPVGWELVRLTRSPAGGRGDGTLRTSIEAQKAHVRLLRTVCARAAGRAFQPTKPNQRSCRPSCRALASRLAAASRLVAVLERLDPCDRGRPE
ncbi:MAG TPA: hypothetical protein VJ837_04130, partial [Candidatus Paceibacterota bacterium]|nr:hypothetical protein [Candidatus Paceibacterota bacterium]